MYYPGPLHKISSQSVHNFLSYVVHRQTSWQTDKPTLPKTLEALSERRPPWPRQIITPILSTVKMLSLGGERLLPPSKKSLLILEYPDHHQNVISSSLYYPGLLHKISSQSVDNFLSDVVHRQTDRQTNQHYQKHNLLCQGCNNLLCQGGNYVGPNTMACNKAVTQEYSAGN